MPIASPHASPAPSSRHAMFYQRQLRGEVPAPMRAIVWSSFGSANLHLANPHRPAEKALIDTVIELCEKKGIPAIPPVYVADTKILNAASVSGHGLVYTTGIMRSMNHDQLAAITGHELSHHRHAGRDMLITAALGIAGYSAARWGWNLLASTALSSKNGVLQGIGHAMDALHTYPVPEYFGIMAAATPWRHFMELEADREGAQATSPTHMKSALERLNELAHTPSNTVGQRSLINKMLRAVLAPFPTHPSTDYRIGQMEKIESPSR